MTPAPPILAALPHPPTGDPGRGTRRLASLSVCNQAPKQAARPAKLKSSRASRHRPTHSPAATTTRRAMAAFISMPLQAAKAAQPARICAARFGLKTHTGAVPVLASRSPW